MEQVQTKWLYTTPFANIENFYVSDDKRGIMRSVCTAQHYGTSTLQLEVPATSTDLSRVFDKAWLMSAESPKYSSNGPRIRVIDLFAGCGGLSFGIKEAAQALGGFFESRFASDIDEGALSIYSRNLSPFQISTKPIEEVLNPDFYSSRNATEIDIKNTCGEMDFLIGGPPCQGHSDLNNHTRRNDPRNELYGIMARAAKTLKPSRPLIVD